MNTKANGNGKCRRSFWWGAVFGAGIALLASGLTSYFSHKKAPESVVAVAVTEVAAPNPPAPRKISKLRVTIAPTKRTASQENDSARSPSIKGSIRWAGVRYPDEGEFTQGRPPEQLCNFEWWLTGEAIELMRLSTEETRALQAEINRWRDRMSELVRAHMKPLEFDLKEGCIGRYEISPYKAEAKEEVDVFLDRADAVLKGKGMDQLTRIFPLDHFAGIGSMKAEISFYDRPGRVIGVDVEYHYEFKDAHSDKPRVGGNGSLETFYSQFGKALELNTVASAETR